MKKIYLVLSALYFSLGISPLKAQLTSDKLKEQINILQRTRGPQQAYALVAISGLAQKGTDCTPAIPLLISFLDDTHEVLIKRFGVKYSETPVYICVLAKNAIVDIGKPTVPALIRRAKQPTTSGYDTGKRIAIEALGEIGDLRALPVLHQQLRRKGNFTRQTLQAVYQIGGTDAWNILVEVLQNQPGDPSYWAAHHLARLNPKKAAPLLEPYVLRWIKTPSRKTSAIALIRSCQIKKAVPILIRTINEPDSSARSFALSAMEVFPVPAKLLPRLVQLATDSKNAEDARKLIAKINDPKARNFLEDLLLKKDEALRIAAMSALGNLADPQSIPALAHCLSDPSSPIRINAIIALNKIPGSESFDLLLQKLPSMPPKEALLIQSILRQRPITDPSSLQKMLTDPNPEIRANALKALLKTEGSPKLDEQILGMLADPITDVRLTAALALGYHHDLNALIPLIHAFHIEKKDAKNRFHTEAYFLYAEALGKLTNNQMQEANSWYRWLLFRLVSLETADPKTLIGEGGPSISNIAFKQKKTDLSTYRIAAQKLLQAPEPEKQEAGFWALGLLGTPADLALIKQHPCPTPKLQKAQNTILKWTNGWGEKEGH